MSWRSLKLTFCYEGTDYAGWQIQDNSPSVQEALEKTWKKITGETLRITASGRTDSGVHALAQVASLATETRLPNEELRRALCAETPEDIAVLAVEDAAEGFHAIREAVGKRYRYQIHNSRTPPIFDRRFVWHQPRPLDVPSMLRASQTLVGCHDFSSFESAGAKRMTSVRTVSDLTIAWATEGWATEERGTGIWGAGIRGAEGSSDRITIEIAADGFLYNMVRIIVGSLVEVGRGAQSESWLAEVLAAKDREKAGQTAPPQGLFLVKVDY